jgi:hypothetical protein
MYSSLDKALTVRSFSAHVSSRARTSSKSTELPWNVSCRTHRRNNDYIYDQRFNSRSGILAAHQTQIPEASSPNRKSAPALHLAAIRR